MGAMKEKEIVTPTYQKKNFFGIWYGPQAYSFKVLHQSMEDKDRCKSMFLNHLNFV